MTGLELRTEGGRTVAVLRGDIDLANARALQDELAASLYEGQAVLDLSGVTYLDSQGVRLVHFFAQRHLAGRLELTLVLPPEGAATRILALTGVADLVPVEPA